MRHPTQAYEIITASFVLFILWPERTWLGVLKPGGVFWTFLALSSLNRFILEAFRGDSSVFLEGFRTMQVLSLAILLTSLCALRKTFPENLTTDRIGDERPS